ncbi:MAG: Asp-tRNA(Asn)/Glu-tRNA(Gln) amidotransferase subunit GatC, partial [Bacteroidia bacterium]|nr:Asp-tRNA(Asn)/Glu-tRNA(Gln) amidotransferase subunit GatC [Bacteroidia bacterium]
LSKLEFDEQEKEKIKTDLGRILGFVDQLNKVDVTGLEPLIYVNEDINVLRDDTIHTNITQEEALSNAPQKDSDYFKVPKVLKK